MSRFDKTGYLVVEDLLKRKISAVIEEIDAEIEQRVRATGAVGELSRDYAEYGFEYRLAKVLRGDGPNSRSALWNGALAGPAIFRSDPPSQLLDIAEPFLRAGLIASSVYRPAPQGAQPCQRPGSLASGFRLFRAILRFQGAGPDRLGCRGGCDPGERLYVGAAGRHKGPVYRHPRAGEKVVLEIPPEDLPDAAPVCVPMRKGSILLLTNRTRTPPLRTRRTSCAGAWICAIQSASLPTNAAITPPSGGEPAGSGKRHSACLLPAGSGLLVRSRLASPGGGTDPAVFRAHTRQSSGAARAQRW